MKTKAKSNVDNLKELTGECNGLQKTVTDIASQLAATDQNLHELQAKRNYLDLALNYYVWNGLQNVVTEISSQLAATDQNFQELQTERYRLDLALKSYVQESDAKHDTLLAMLTKMTQNQRETRQKQNVGTDFWQQQAQEKGESSLPSSSAPATAAESGMRTAVIREHKQKQPVHNPSDSAKYNRVGDMDGPQKSDPISVHNNYPVDFIFSESSASRNVMKSAIGVNGSEKYDLVEGDSSSDEVGAEDEEENACADQRRAGDPNKNSGGDEEGFKNETVKEEEEIPTAHNTVFCLSPSFTLTGASYPILVYLQSTSHQWAKPFEFDPARRKELEGFKITAINGTKLKGGLIGLAAATVGLSTEATQHLGQIVPPVLNCFSDKDRRARYQACEALYIIALSDSDKSVLLMFKNSVYDPTGLLLSWSFISSNQCSWFGISCDSISHVVPLNISGNGSGGNSLSCFDFTKFPLYGLGIRRNGGENGGIWIRKLTPLLGKLSALRILSLHFNSFEGEVPDEIWGIKNLDILDLEENLITGLLPNHLTGWNNRRVVNHLKAYLSFNWLTGSILFELGGSCGKLEHLDLSGNYLIHGILRSLGNDHQLKTLLLYSKIRILWQWVVNFLVVLLVNFARWKYSLIRHCWVCQPMNHPRCLFGSSSLRSIAIVAGGTNYGVNALKSAELYDSLTGRLNMLPAMHTFRKLCSGFVMGGKFYVIGGMSSLFVSLTCGENDETTYCQLRSFAVESYLCIIEEPKLLSLFRQDICWDLGEYGTADGKYSASYTTEKLCGVAGACSVDEAVKAYVITSLMKLHVFQAVTVRKLDLLRECQNLIEELSASHSTDLQQCAYELQALVGLNVDAVKYIMEEKKGNPVAGLIDKMYLARNCMTLLLSNNLECKISNDELSFISVANEEVKEVNHTKTVIPDDFCLSDTSALGDKEKQ